MEKRIEKKINLYSILFYFIILFTLFKKKQPNRYKKRLFYLARIFIYEMFFGVFFKYKLYVEILKI